MSRSIRILFIALCLATMSVPVFAQNLNKLKGEAANAVEDKRIFTQQMVDMIFSFSELGFQEFETSRYITEILSNNGFEIETNAAGIPTAWFARWGSGKPVISIGSDFDGLPETSQKPGVAYQSPLIEGAPGHGEGHNAGQAVNVTAALVVKEIMERENMSGTLILWPGVAEELVGTKAYFVRAGYFEGVDLTIFTHVSNNMSVQYGPGTGTGLVSVEYTFSGQTAHGAGAPWRGRSALDAVELMNSGWNFRREHLRPLQRSHYVITNGGSQPNVVPSEASVWYYFREIEYENIKKNFEIGNTMAQAAAMMTNTEVESRILGTAWPRHFNKTIAETMYENIEEVGLPNWSDDDQALAKAVQKVMGADEPEGLKTEIEPLPEPIEEPQSGGSDDIGDVSWNVPTVTLRFPSNVSGLPGHHWSNAVTMATPIAHKGATAGAKVVAMTLLDFLLKEELVEEAWDYFNTVQAEAGTYIPLISKSDMPAIDLNEEKMNLYRPMQKEFYYDPSRYDSYLEQLGIEYPTLEK